MTALPEIPAGWSAATELPAPPKGWSLEGDAPGAPFQFAGGFNTGLSQYTEGPERAIEMGLQFLHGEVPTWAGTKAPLTSWLRNSVAAPQTTGQRMARRVGEEFGANVPYAGMSFAGAPAVAAASRYATPSTANLATRSANTLARGVVNTPGRAALGETLAITGSGTGAGIANEIAPGDENAEMIGQFAGGLSPAATAYSPSALAARGMNFAASRLSPEAQRQAARRVVRDVVGPGLDKSAIKDTEALKQQIPGYNPSLAEATGSPSLVATQRALESQASGQSLENIAARRASNEKAISDFAESKTPQASGPDVIVDTMTRRVTDLTDALSKKQTNIETGRESLARGLPVTNNTTVGQTLREGYLKRRDAVRASMGQLSRELLLDDIDLTEPFQKYRQFSRDLLGDRSWLADPDGAPRAALRVTKGSEEAATPIKTSFKDVMAFRSGLEAEKRDAISGQVPNADRARQLSIMVKELDNWLAGALESAAPETKAAYDTFRKRYKEEYIDRFNQGAAFKVRQKDGRGFYQTTDERVADLFWRDAEAAKQFKRTYGNDAPEQAALASVILDDLRASAARDGTIDPKSHQAWLARNSSVLNEFPDVLRKVTDIGVANEGLLLRGKELAEREKAIGQSLLSKSLSQISGGKSISQVIDDAMARPKLMGTIARSVVKEPDAQKALARQVFSKVADAPVSEMQKFLTENRSALQIALTPKHLSDLETIMKASEQLARVPLPAGRGYDPNSLADVERRLGTGMNQISSRIFAVQSGRTSWRYVALDLLSRFWRGHSQQETAKLLNEALYNPEIARDLADMIDLPSQREATAKRLNTWLLQIGGPDEQEQK